MLSKSQRRLGPHQITFLGGPSVGKTCLVMRCLGKALPSKYVPTTDDIYKTDICCACGKTVSPLQITDTSGECLFPGMRDDSIANAHGAVIAFNLNDENSLDEAVEILHHIRRVRSGKARDGLAISSLYRPLDNGRTRSASLSSADTSTEKKNKRSVVDAAADANSVRVVFVGCKSDLIPNKTDRDNIHFRRDAFVSPRAASIAHSMGCAYTEVSAFSGERVEEVLNSLLPETCATCYQNSLRQESANSHRRWTPPSSPKFRRNRVNPCQYRHSIVDELRREQKWHVLTASL